ncbi:MAG: ribonuclease HII [Nitrospirae bacterium]|nr:ribonuclease HII [Candidatus Manganitrophaceae bacterium]
MPLDTEEARRLFKMTLFERILSLDGYRQVCGIDEAGRGPLAGPVVAAAVILPAAISLPGIRDSKLLTAKQREAFYERILQEAIAVGVGVVDNITIDEINILQATYLAMQKSLQSLRIQPDYLLIDALTLPNTAIPQRGLIRGDNLSVSIAAASIVAKVTRDRLMDQYHQEFPSYNFISHKGYGTGEHLKNIRMFGPCHIHRKSFRGVLS